MPLKLVFQYPAFIQECREIIADQAAPILSQVVLVTVDSMFPCIR